MRIRHTTVRLGMLIAAGVAAGAFAAATPANAAVISHSPPTASAAQLDAAVHPDGTAAPDGPYPVAYDEFTIALTGSPKPSMPYVCHSEDIELTAGEYEWDGFIGLSYPHNFDVDVYLASGNYNWQDCLQPEPGYYLQQSALCDLNLPAASYPCVSQSPEVTITSGTYTVGSWLDWLYL